MNINHVSLETHGSLQYGNNPQYLILHHADMNGTIQDVNRVHLNNGWTMIGYNYYVRKDGSIWKGRLENAIGANCYGYNDKSVSICAEGNFMNDTMSDAQKYGIIWLGQYIEREYGNRLQVIGHKEVYATDCPGDNYPLSEIKNAITNGNSQPEPSQPTNNNPIEAGKKFVGSRCKELQQDLISLGYNCGGYGADGEFGQGTYNSLIQFQKDNSLEADGLAGTQTFACLQKKIAEKNQPKVTGNANVRALQHLCNELDVRDMSGKPLDEDGIIGQCTNYAVSHLPLCGVPYHQPTATRYIQSKLGVLVDGIFGQQTKNTVIAFQKQHGLDSDGIVGQNTWKSFLNN